MTPGSPFSPCKKGGSTRGDGGTRLPPVAGLASPPGPVGQVGWGTRSVTTPWGRGGLEQLPSTPGSPGDQMTPGLLSVPLGPAGRSTEPMSAPTHQRQTPNTPSITTTLAPLWQSAAELATRDFTKAFIGAIPAVPSPASNSPGSQRDPACPVGRSRDACKSNPPLSKKPGAQPALLRVGCGSQQGTYLWTRQSHQRLLEKETKWGFHPGLCSEEVRAHRGVSLYPPAQWMLGRPLPISILAASSCIEARSHHLHLCLRQ